MNWTNLSLRERIGISVGAFLLVVVLADLLVVGPIRSRRHRLERRHDVAVEEVALMEALASRYDAVARSGSGLATALAARKPGFTLFGFLDGLSGRAGVKRQVVSMTPSTRTDSRTKMRYSVVETRLEGVSMAEWIRFLHAIESAPENVTVTRMSLSRSGGKETGMIVTFVAETVMGA